MSFPDTPQVVQAFRDAEQALLTRLGQYHQLTITLEAQAAGTAELQRQLAEAGASIERLAAELDAEKAKTTQLKAKVAEFFEHPEVKAADIARMEKQKVDLEARIAERKR